VATEKPNIDPEFEEVTEGEALEEVGYLLEGTLVLELEGRSPVTLKVGDFFLIEHAGPTMSRAWERRKRKVLST
jgi:uncharacterized cupin superfamily protein